MAAVDDLVPTFVLLFPLPLAELSYTAPQRLHNFPAVLLWVMCRKNVLYLELSINSALS